MVWKTEKAVNEGSLTDLEKEWTLFFYSS